MGSSIGFYCGLSDNEELELYAKSIGLHTVASSMDGQVFNDPVSGPFCYLSLVEKAELHPFGNPPVRISDAKDPILRFMRAYFCNPYLVVGHIYWSNDVPALASQTKPYYQKLARWIRKEWSKYGDFYVGPEAKSLIDKGAELVNVLPDSVDVQVIKI